MTNEEAALTAKLEQRTEEINRLRGMIENRDEAIKIANREIDALNARNAELLMRVAGSQAEESSDVHDRVREFLSKVHRDRGIMIVAIGAVWKGDAVAFTMQTETAPCA